MLWEMISVMISVFLNYCNQQLEIAMIRVNSWKRQFVDICIWISVLIYHTTCNKSLIFVHWWSTRVIIKYYSNTIIIRMFYSHLPSWFDQPCMYKSIGGLYIYGREIWIPFYSRFWSYYLVHFPPNVQCVVIHRCHLILFLNEKIYRQTRNLYTKTIYKIITSYCTCRMFIYYVRLSKSGLGYTTIHKSGLGYTTVH